MVMKKILLTVGSILAALSMLADGADSAFIKAWTANRIIEKSVKKAILNFNDTILYNKRAINGGANVGNPQQATYVTSYDSVEKALSIHYTYTGDGTKDQYSEAVYFGYGYSQDTSAANKVAKKFNPFLANGDVIKGTFIDMSDSLMRNLKLICKIKDLASTDSVSVRVDIYDVNGRETNSNKSGVKRAIKPSSEWQILTYIWSYDSGNDPGNLAGWNEQALMFYDGYQGNWWGISNGHYSTPEPGFPSIVLNSSEFAVPLEPKYILPKFLVQFNPGAKTDAWVANMGSGKLDGDFTLLIREVDFGDIDSQNLTADEQFEYGQHIVASKIVEGKKLKVSQSGDIFRFEGKAKLINILGQVVATGVDVIDASSLTPGVYFIIVDGRAKEVIVK